ncbi:MAG: HAD-IA family hydrolase, partial [Candidatus Dormibacteraeota bacterium]|nr:HAD-IA family hydrolase [Candidatus Dormibacteraeota bacterium]
SDDQLRETWGLRIADLVDHWYRSRPWTGVRPKAVQNEIVREMIGHVRSEGVPLPGAVEAVNVARDAGLSVAIASSSAGPMIEAVVDRLGIGDVVAATCTADDEKLGKPDPGVYLTAAKCIGVDAGECIAVEDSPFGIQSAKRAGMFCVGVRTDAVDSLLLTEADIEIGSLREFTADLLGRIAYQHIDVTGRRSSV